jgi:hypothetical protein
MKHIIALVAFMLTVVSVCAAEFSYRFDSIPVSQALSQIGSDHQSLKISFIYNELETYRTSARIDTDDAYEAIRQTIGLNPISVVRKGDDFYVEALQHGKYCYTGRLSGPDGETVAGASVLLLVPKDSTVITYGIADDRGRFAIPCDKKEVIAKFTCLGYMPTYHKCDDFTLGTVIMQPLPVQLKAVSVEAANALAYSDRTVYLPTGNQRRAAQNAIDLLCHMAIPQIKIDRVTGSVSDNLGKTVEIFINYVAATSEDITGLRTTDVRRVEYLEFPIDPRFRGAQRVINIIVQEYVYGGYTKASAYESFLTGLSNEANIYSKFVYKKMTYDFYAGTSNYKRRDEGNSIESVYTLADENGDKYKVDRNLTLGNSKSKNNSYPVSFRALYVADKTQINNTVGFFHNDYKGDETGTLTYSSFPKETGEYYTGSKFRNNGVVYEGSYFFAIRSGWSFDVSSSFSYTHRNRNTDKIERVSINRYAKENAIDYRVNVSLNKQFSRSNSMLFRFKKHARMNWIRYSGNYAYYDKFSQDFYTWMAGYNFNNGKWGVNADGGLVWEHTNISGLKNDDVYPFAHLNLIYTFNPKNRLGVFLQYATFSAGVSEMTTTVLRENELMYITGNPNLKNSRSVDADFSYSFFPSNKFALNAFSQFNVRFTPQVIDYRLYDGGKALLRSWNNGVDYYINGCVGVSSRFTLLDGNLQLSISPVWYFNRFKGIYNVTHNPFRAEVNATYYWGNLYCQAYYSSPGVGFFTTTGAKYKGHDYYNVAFGWANNNWNIRVVANNFFNKRFSTTTREYSTPLYSEKLIEHTSSYRPCIRVGLIYTFGYGKKVRRDNEIGAQEGAGSAILK